MYFSPLMDKKTPKLSLWGHFVGHKDKFIIVGRKDIFVGHKDNFGKWEKEKEKEEKEKENLLVCKTM